MKPPPVKSWTVPTALASKARTVHAAGAAAAAVFECRVLVQLLNHARLTESELDDKLHEIELAYHRRADELVKPPKKPARKASR